MKFLVSQLSYFWQDRHSRANVYALLRYLLLLAAMVTLYSILFHFIMAYEGREESWVTGFGDITFESDLGRIFSSIVLLSGIIFMLVILPFTFINLFYAPWLRAQEAARAPKSLPDTVKGHVILTQYDAVTSTDRASEAIPLSLCRADARAGGCAALARFGRKGRAWRPG